MAEEVEVPEVTEEQLDAEFESGFANKPTEESPPAEVAPLEKVEEQKLEPKYVQITEEDWQKVLAKATEIDQIKADYAKKIDAANGRYGELARTLQTMQAASTQGYSVEVTDDIVGDLKKEFPELGSLTLSAFKAFAAKLKGTAAQSATVDPKQIADLVQEQFGQERQLTTKEILAMRHEDWEEIVGAPDSKTEYREWLAKQPAAYQSEIGSSWNARKIAGSIDKFKVDKTAAEKAAAEALKAQRPASTRQQRLEAAVTPRGTGGHAPAKSADDEFEAGFKEG